MGTGSRRNQKMRRVEKEMSKCRFCWFAFGPSGGCRPSPRDLQNSRSLRPAVLGSRYAQPPITGSQAHQIPLG